MVSFTRKFLADITSFIGLCRQHEIDLAVHHRNPHVHSASFRCSEERVRDGM